MREWGSRKKDDKAYDKQGRVKNKKWATVEFEGR